MVKSKSAIIHAPWFSQLATIALIELDALTIEGLSRFGLDRIAQLEPQLPSAIHRSDVGVSHSLERVCRKGRSVTTSAIQDYLGAMIRDGGLDVAFDYAFA
jgi:hypothetical protein